MSFAVALVANLQPVSYMIAMRLVGVMIDTVTMAAAPATAMIMEMLGGGDQDDGDTTHTPPLLARVGALLFALMSMSLVAQVTWCVLASVLTIVWRFVLHPLVHVVLWTLSVPVRVAKVTVWTLLWPLRWMHQLGDKMTKFLKKHFMDGFEEQVPQPQDAITKRAPPAAQGASKNRKDKKRHDGDRRHDFAPAAAAANGIIEWDDLPPMAPVLAYNSPTKRRTTAQENLWICRQMKCIGVSREIAAAQLAKRTAMEIAKGFYD